MLVYLKGEAGAHVVDGLLQSQTENCYAHSVNLCEVYYDFLRRSNESTAREAIADLYADGVTSLPQRRSREESRFPCP